MICHYRDQNITNMDLSSVSEQIQAEVQIKQFRDFLIQYNKLSESCFTDCVWDFTSRNIRNNEDNCVVNCVEKYTKVCSSCYFYHEYLFECTLGSFMQMGLIRNF